VPNTLPISKQPVGAAYHRNLTSDLLNFQSESVDLLTLSHAVGTFCFRRGIIATTKCSCRDNQRLEGDVGFGLQGLRRGGERWFQALPGLRNIKTGFTTASIHYQTHCPSAPLARVIAYRVSALVSAAAC
jgi:hypothetical protein